jgi:aspartate/methionine/tyrosine aminotransferase
MILATVKPGDEVIIFTPAYDSYAPMIRRAGATPREVALRPPNWRIERETLEAAVTARTSAVIFNNPHNPTGRLFGADELQIIADVATARDLTVVSDEVWEHVLLHGESFIPLASLPGMAGRTMKAGSAGKIFSLTGWKVGWIVASPENAAVAARAHQFLTFATAPNLQAAVAFGLEQGDSWIEPMRQRFSRALGRMGEGLRKSGFEVLEPASTYFLCVDLKASGLEVDDETFARAAVERAGVATVPVSAFAEEDPSRHLVRLCFAKRDETIDAGVEAMARAKELFA